MDRVKLIGWTALAAGLALAGAMPATAATTVLSFPGAICGVAGTAACSNSSQIGQGYGDSAIVDVVYRTTTLTGVTDDNFLKYWSTGYGDLTGVVWGGSDPTTTRSEIRFVPVAGYEVSLIGFDAACYLNRASCQTLNYTVTSGLGAAIVAGATSTAYPGHASLALNTGYFTDGIVLTWGPDGYDVGLDNIAFDVRQTAAPGAVPEPASWALMIGGFGLAGVAVRRRLGKTPFVRTA